MAVSSVGSVSSKDFGVQDASLFEACQDFEAVFLETLWKGMQKGLGGSLGGYEFFTEEIMGKVWAEGGGIGLAKVIYNSVSNHPSMQ